LPSGHHGFRCERTTTRTRHPLTNACSVEAIMARTVGRQRPHSPPAPHAVATSFDVHAPFCTTSTTWRLVTPWHKHTNIESTPGQPRVEMVVRTGAQPKSWHEVQ
jgi:hypothetical protein